MLHLKMVLCSAQIHHILYLHNLEKMQIRVQKSLLAIFTVHNLRTLEIIQCISQREPQILWGVWKEQTSDYIFRYFITIIQIMQILYVLSACITTDALNASFLTNLWLLILSFSWWVNSSSTFICNPQLVHNKTFSAILMHQT